VKKLKILAVLTGVAIIAAMTGCTGCNKTIIDTTCTFDEAIICVGGEWKTIEVKEWADYADGGQIQIVAKDGTIYLVHANNCTLICNNK
jgi:hypothetical protein